MASPDPIAAERQMYLKLLGIADDPSFSMAYLKERTAGGANVNSAVKAAPDTVMDGRITALTTVIDGKVTKGDLVINVKDYGAVADWNGMTGSDNLAAFTSALAAAPSGGGVYVPPGRYHLSGTLNITRPVWLTGSVGGIAGDEGSSPFATQLHFPAGVTGIHVYKGAQLLAPDGTAIANLDLLSSSTVTGTDVGVLCTDGRVELDRITVSRFGSHGFHLKAGTEVGGGNVNLSTLSSCRAYGNRGDGFRFEGGDCNAVLAVKLDATANYGWGFNNEGTANNVIQHPHADQQYFSSPGAYRDNGLSNVYEHVYSEMGVTFQFAASSSVAEVTCSTYGRPSFTDLSSAKSAAIVDTGANVGSCRIGSPDRSKTFRFDVGTVMGPGTGNGLALLLEGGKLLWSYHPNFDVYYQNVNTLPGTTGTYNIGGTSDRWLNLYLSGFVSLGTFATGSRPSAEVVPVGAMIYDTTLSKPIWSDGTSWRDAAGTVV